MFLLSGSCRNCFQLNQSFSFAMFIISLQSYRTLTEMSLIAPSTVFADRQCGHTDCMMHEEYHGLAIWDKTCFSGVFDVLGFDRVHGQTLYNVSFLPWLLSAIDMIAEEFLYICEVSCRLCITSCITLAALGNRHKCRIINCVTSAARLIIMKLYRWARKQFLMATSIAIEEY